MLKLLLEDLKDHIQYTRLNQAETALPQRVLLLDQDAPTQGGLYVCVGADAVATLAGLEEGKPFLLFTAGDGAGLAELERADLLLIVTDLPLARLHNRLVSWLTQLEQWRQMLRVGARQGVRGLMDALGSMAGATAYALSSYGQVITTSPKAEGFESMVALLEENLYVSQKGLQELFRGFPQDRREPHCAQRDGMHYCIAPVLGGNRLLGHVLVGGVGGGENLTILTQLAARSMEKVLARAEPRQEGYVAFQTLVMELFSDPAGDLEELQLRLQRLPKRPKKYMRGILIRTQDQPADPSSALMGELERLFFRDNVAVFQDDYYVLASHSKANSQLDTEREELEQILKTYDAYALVANPSVRTRGLRVLYRQCKQTLDIAVAVRYRTEARCLFFDRYSMYHAVDLCASNMLERTGTDDVVFLCHPGLLSLRRYDKALNNNLQDVLFHYLMNDRSIAKTAQDLFLHRNTTIYKINKIKSLIGSSMEDPYLRQQLLFSCLLLRYVECYLGKEIELSPLERDALSGG